ncbi:uncharacterized protein LOC129569672 [Sitodiplosis mosellana]|uniref:uncharacterized protein LOC129569672 n=1 Tax=Sitodiplosis mosellana TaxID=263140 RepID=UPI0024451B67|nr:uncharacterized protein LOC129569672 [Sitodiplosis mosellana]
MGIVLLSLNQPISKRAKKQSGEHEHRFFSIEASEHINCVALDAIGSLLFETLSRALVALNHFRRQFSKPRNCNFYSVPEVISSTSCAFTISRVIKHKLSKQNRTTTQGFVHFLTVNLRSSQGFSSTEQSDCELHSFSGTSFSHQKTKNLLEMNSTRQWCTVLLVVGISMLLISVAESAPRYSGYYSENVDETPEDVLMELIARFGQTLMRARDEVANSKRTVDFGLGRGLSGAIEAKHRLGMAAANFAGGPGRRRRSENTV